MLAELFFVFLCKENQERANFELGEVKGIFYQNPTIIIFIFTVTVLVPQMTWQLQSCAPYLSLLLHFVRLSWSCRQLTPVGVKFAVMLMNKQKHITSCWINIFFFICICF